MQSICNGTDDQTGNNEWKIFKTKNLNLGIYKATNRPWFSWKSWTEPSTWRVSSSQVGLVVGKKPSPQTTHLMADLALLVAGGWWTRFMQILFRLQTAESAVHMNVYYFMQLCYTIQHRTVGIISPFIFIIEMSEDRGAFDTVNCLVFYSNWVPVTITWGWGSTRSSFFTFCGMLTLCELPVC